MDQNIFPFGVLSLWATEYGILDDVTIRHLPGILWTLINSFQMTGFSSKFSSYYFTPYTKMRKGGGPIFYQRVSLIQLNCTTVSKSSG